MLAHFSNIRAVADASPDELALCPGMGPTKVQRLWDALHKPFSKRAAQERKKQKDKSEQEAVVPGSANGNDASAPTTEEVNNDKQDEEEENRVNAGDDDSVQDAIKECGEATNEANGKYGQPAQAASNESFQRSSALVEQHVVDLTWRSRSKTQAVQAASNENFQRSLALAEQDDFVDLTFDEQNVVDLTSTSTANNVSSSRVTIPTISASNFYAKATIATNALLSSQGTTITQRAASQTSTKAVPFNPYSTSKVVPSVPKPKITKPKTTRTLTSLLSGVKTTDALLNPTPTATAANSVQHASRNLKTPSLPPPAYKKTSDVVASTNSERQKKEQKSRKKRKNS